MSTVLENSSEKGKRYATVKTYKRRRAFYDASPKPYKIHVAVSQGLLPSSLTVYQLVKSFIYKENPGT